jgi:Mlc titration factor MtfA (ptsG expression regulator)
VSWFRSWRRARVLRHATIDADIWRASVLRYPFITDLDAAEIERLRELTILFLHEKSMHGAGGMRLADEVRIAVAAQACMLILNLDLDYYRGWVEIIVYPDEFVAEYEHVDDAGVVHRIEAPMSGESWQGGPAILSWADAEEAGGGGYNVVIHEFAHKLDMLNGEANGFPPLHSDMHRDAWARAFTAAYDDFCRDVDAGARLLLDEYAAESPAEFFAVISEAFFECPQEVRASYPEVYAQLVQFYRQDPAARADAAESTRAAARARA